MNSGQTGKRKTVLQIILYIYVRLRKFKFKIIGLNWSVATWDDRRYCIWPAGWLRHIYQYSITNKGTCSEHLTSNFSTSGRLIRLGQWAVLQSSNCPESRQISIFNLSCQTIKTSRNKPNMSKVKRQVGPRSRLAAASCKEAQIGLVGLQCAGGLGGFR